MSSVTATSTSATTQPSKDITTNDNNNKPVKPHLYNPSPNLNKPLRVTHLPNNPPPITLKKQKLRLSLPLLVHQHQTKWQNKP